MEKILLVENRLPWVERMQRALSGTYETVRWTPAEKLEGFLQRTEIHAVLLSLQLEGEDPLALLRRLKRLLPYIPVVAMSEVPAADLVVKAIKAGAYDFVVMPFIAEKLRLCLQRALEHRGLQNEIDYLRRKQDVVYDFGRIIAKSPSMRKVIAELKRFGRTDSTILITGETGTGKSFLSGTIHFNSKRRARPFIKINCANIPETLLESELFGHEKGAFTGASKTRIGRVEQARGGTVFLDEIGELSSGLQAKLLRVLEEKSFERVGGNLTIHADVRIIAATNRSPEELVREGKFREDLYYRLNVLRVELPPLRERPDCIEPLARHLLQKICGQISKEIQGFDAGVLGALQDYDWPGNIRQLSNVIERAAILEDTELLQIQNVLIDGAVKRSAPSTPAAAQDISLKDREREMILGALEKTLWIQKDAAQLLGISPRSLNYKIRKLGITHPRWRKNRR